jgi:MFS transporter, AAHS family, 4-hydroxybenzoate transporter
MTSLVHDSDRINVIEVIDKAPIGALQIQIIVLCCLVSMLDGFDTQSIAFVAPSISRIWSLPPARFGSIFSATLLGTAIGAVVFGRLADRYGRRKLIAIAVAAFGSMTIACAFAGGVLSLAILRFLAGLGLGGAIPNFLAYASEFAPERARSTIVVVTLWGFPAGAVLGGLASTQLIEQWGWSSVFIAGGALPLILAPILFLILPESIRYLTLQPSSGPLVAMTLRRIDESFDYPGDAAYFLPEKEAPSRRVREVFEGRLAVGTTLLGGALFMSLLLAYLLVNWIPLLFRAIGMPLGDALLGAVVLNSGGIAGSYVFSRLIDRTRGALPLMSASYSVAALAIGTLGVFGVSRGLILSSTGIVGFFLIGTQMSLTAYIADYYPSALRATGIGLTQAIGRCGSLIGPLLGGLLLSIGMSPQGVLRFGALPALGAVVALLTLHATNRQR